MAAMAIGEQVFLAARPAILKIAAGWH